MGGKCTKPSGGKGAQLELWDDVGQLIGENPFKKGEMPSLLDSGSDWSALFSQLNWHWQTNRFPGNQKQVIRDAFMELKGYDFPIVSIRRARDLLKRIVEDSGEYRGMSDWIDSDIFKDEFLVKCAELFIKKVIEILCRSELLKASDALEVEVCPEMINGFREFIKGLLDA